ncbi:MAG TPA: DUF4235 domain-containing protein [Solirubrobacteraceae bacterium]|jgi:hypothetical protein|nr:DUF4235 domain-containing protein [Solirubrobacteraceae bacterium]
MAKLISLPLRLVAGIAAGLAGKSLFRGMWRLIDDQEAPKAEQRRISLGMLALALVIEGALFRALKGLADHASRRVFASLTGSWPGEEQPEAK